MELLSGLGDIAVVGPASIALFVALIWLGARRAAAAFAVAILAAIALALAAKLVFAVCGLGASRFAIESPSGHAALGSAFWGAVAANVAGGRRRRERVAIYGAAVCVAVAIAYGRVALGAHTVAEVVCGLAIGVAATALFVALRGPPQRLSLTPQLAARIAPIAGLLALDLAIFANRWTTEAFIARLAATLGISLNLCS